jgi:hypothetical protein
MRYTRGLKSNGRPIEIFDVSLFKAFTPSMCRFLKKYLTDRLNLAKEKIGNSLAPVAAIGLVGLFPFKCVFHRNSYKSFRNKRMSPVPATCCLGARCTCVLLSRLLRGVRGPHKSMETPLILHGLTLSGTHKPRHDFSVLGLQIFRSNIGIIVSLEKMN